MKIQLLVDIINLNNFTFIKRLILNTFYILGIHVIRQK